MVATTRSSITENVCTILIYFNIPFNSYNYVLFDIDDKCAYLNNLLISLSSDAEKAKKELYDVKNKVEEKNTRIENLLTKISNVSIDSDAVCMDCQIKK